MLSFHPERALQFGSSGRLDLNLEAGPRVKLQALCRQNCAANDLASGVLAPARQPRCAQEVARSVNRCPAVMRDKSAVALMR
jgi:hypothetical protein